MVRGGLCMYNVYYILHTTLLLYVKAERVEVVVLLQAACRSIHVLLLRLL